MSDYAVHVGEAATIPAPEADLTRDEIIDAITKAKRPGVRYGFELYRGPECEHCGKPGSPLMRFARTVRREAWIVGTPDDGTRDKLVCPIRTVEPRFDPDAAATVVGELEAIVVTLNLREASE